MSEKDFEERDKIINAARRLVMADGVDEVSLSDIAREAGVTGETLNKYLKDKDELIMELIGERFGMMSDALLNMPLRKKTKAFNFEIMKQIELIGIQVAKQWIASQVSNINYYQNGKKMLHDDTERFKSLLEASIAKGELRDDTPVEELAIFNVNIIYGLMLNWCINEQKFEPLYHIDTFSDFIVNAMIPYMNK